MGELNTSREKFDIVFLEAYKEQCILFYNLALEMLTPSGCIMAHNSLWGLLYNEGDSRRQRLDEFNKMVKDDSKVEQVIVPLEKGVSIIRPKRC